MGTDERQDEAAVRLLIELYHNHYCVAHDVAPAERGRVAAHVFLDWLEAHWPCLDPETVCAAAGVERGVWDYTRATAEGGRAALQNVWYFIALAKAAPPRVPVLHVTNLLLVRYADGTLAYAHRLLTRDNAGGVIADAQAATYLQQVLPTYLGLVLTEGLDGLYSAPSSTSLAVSGQAGPDAGLRKYLDALQRSLALVDPSYRPCCEYVYLLMRNLLLPPTQPQQQQPAAPTAAPPRPTGGWDA